MTTIQDRLRGPVAAAAQAYTDAWFNNPGTARPVHCIPAKETDTDLVLAQGIKDAAERIDALEKALRDAEADATRWRIFMRDAGEWLTGGRQKFDYQCAHCGIPQRGLCAVNNCGTPYCSYDCFKAACAALGEGD